MLTSNELLLVLIESSSYEEDSESSSDSDCSDSPDEHSLKTREPDPRSMIVLFDAICQMLLDNNPIITPTKFLRISQSSFDNETQKKKLERIGLNNNIHLLTAAYINSLTPSGTAEEDNNALYNLRRLAMWQPSGPARGPDPSALKQLGLFKQEEDIGLIEAWLGPPQKFNLYAAQRCLPARFRGDNTHATQTEELRNAEDVLEPTALQEVFSFLDPFSLAAASQVCRLWHRVSEESPLWLRHIREDLWGRDQCSKDNHHIDGSIDNIEADVDRILKGGRPGEEDESSPVTLKSLFANECAIYYRQCYPYNSQIAFAVATLYTTLHYTTLHYTTLHYTTLQPTYLSLT